MLTMYIDESYSHPPKPLIYTIAGYLSQDWRWRTFESEWNGALSAEGLDYFHMVELAQGKHTYAKWEEKKRRKFLRKLHRIIHKHTLADFAISVVVADYDQVITPDIREGFGEPHVFATIGCLKAVSLWLNKRRLAKRERIVYVFEKGSIHDSNLQQLFDRYVKDDKQRQTYRIEDCAFHDKKELMPLQAADVLAYENMLEMRRRVDPDNVRKPRASWSNLDRTESDWGYFGKAELLELVAACYSSSQQTDRPRPDH
jgi:hypothetical protein